MTKNVFLIVSISMALLLGSCSTYNTMIQANNRVKEVTLGMTKEKVIHIMGQSYRMSGVSHNQKGELIEKIWYPATQKSIFFFTFEGDKLVEWHERFILSPDEELTE